MTNFMVEYEAHRKARVAVMLRNKAALFVALKDAGITMVVLKFDGSGDSGQIGDITYHQGDAEADEPAGSVVVVDIDFFSKETVFEKPVAYAVECVAYDVIAADHDGWENNEGAFGEIIFDVAENTVTLDYNERFESSTFYQHTY